jgi:hypothetical protein
MNHNVVGNTKVLIHVDTVSRVGDVIDGRPIVLPANEPVELPTFIAEAVERHIGHLYGIVEVEQVRNKAGVTWALEEAMAKAKEYLVECDKATVNFYVRQQMEDRIAAGKPALPPTGHALEVIVKNKINLRKSFGITPVGWTEPDTDHAYNDHAQVEVGVGVPNKSVEVLTQKTREQEVTIELLQKQQQESAAKFDELSSKFDKLMNMLSGDGQTGAGVEPVQEQH